MATSTRRTTPIVNANRHQIYHATDSINWAPRFGFTWSPGGSDHTVISGGFGIFYDALPAFVGDNFMTNLPNEVEERLAITMALSSAGPILRPTRRRRLRWPDSVGLRQRRLPGLVGSASGRHSVPQPTYNTQAGTFHTPYYEQWSFRIAAGCWRQDVPVRRLRGNHGVHVPIQNEWPNAYADGYCALMAQRPASAPPPCTSQQFNVFNQYTSSGLSNYNGLTAGFSQRMTYGFTVNASYTWSHTMDEVSNGGSTPGIQRHLVVAVPVEPDLPALQQLQQRRLRYPELLQRQLRLADTWKFGNKFANGAFGGWTLSQNFFARTGLPYSVIDNFTGISNFVRPIRSRASTSTSRATARTASASAMRRRPSTAVMI